MSRVLTFLLITILSLSFTGSASAQEEHHHAYGEELGDVSFPISCKAEVQNDFNHAVALLHSFWYAKAEEAFAKIATADPDCSMAYWGIAMSNYHPVWQPPTPDEWDRGKKASDKAMSLGWKTQREEGLLKAIMAFYLDPQMPHRARAQAYSDAMESLSNKYPEDIEIRAFYGLALLGTASVEDKKFTVQKKAAGVLQPLVEKAPNHPGVAHYIIHSFDYPHLAELALPAARAYAKIAPDSPHALHMPSHIFTRLGYWDESIASNIASAASAKKNVELTQPGAGSFDQLHAMDYLVYAYLQEGKDEEARKVLEEVAAMKKVDASNFAAAYAFAAIPARYNLERHAWKEAAALKVDPTWFPWEKFPYAEAIIYFARGVGAARSDNLSTAQQALERLKALQQESSKISEYWGTQVAIQEQAVAAWVAFEQGSKEDALRIMKEAAAKEAASEKHPVTPGNVYPAQELLGDMLLEMNQPKEAKAAFEKSLETAPKRRNALAELSQAEEQMKRSKASDSPGKRKVKE
jgi:tetratricopeptide (TPR) repeat protein